MTLFDLEGKVAIVTGGNSGIGWGIAQGLAEAGAIIVIAARNEAKSAKAADSLSRNGHTTLAVRCDVTDDETIQAMVQQVLDRFGRIDILVNNAGTNIRKPLEELAFDEWRTVLDTNLDSIYRCCKACYPAMKAGGGGKILNNGSMLSIFGSGWAPAYAASKGGMVQLTKSLAAGWAPDNIQVNCFLPGWIDTPLTVQARKDIAGLEEKILARTPAKRWGHIDDFKGIAIFLASPASDFVTGTAIPVDGGFSVNIL